jgi:uncharacterized membrane protein
VKALSWRIVASLITGGIVFCFTKKSMLALTVGVCDSAIKIVAFFIHERIWMRVPFGIVKHPLGRIEVTKPLEVEHEQVIREKLSEMGYLQ